MLFYTDPMTFTSTGKHLAFIGRMDHDGQYPGKPTLLSKHDLFHLIAVSWNSIVVLLTLKPMQLAVDGLRD